MSRSEVICSDLLQHIRDRGIELAFSNGRITYNDIAAVLMFQLGELADTGIGKKTLRHRIHCHVETIIADPLEIDAWSCPTYCLPSIISKFLGVEVTDSQLLRITSAVAPQKPSLEKLNSRTLVTGRNNLQGIRSSGAATQLAIAASPEAAPGTVVPSSSSTPNRWDGYQASELAMVISDRDQTIQDLRSQLKAVEKSRDHYKQRCSALVATATNQQLALRVATDAMNFRSGWNVSTYGGYSLAIAKSVGYASSSSTVQMVAGRAECGALKSKRNVSVQYLSRRRTGLEISVVVR